MPELTECCEDTVCFHFNSSLVSVNEESYTRATHSALSVSFSAVN